MSESENVSFLIGGLAQQLSVGIYEFQIVFNNNTLISGEGEVLIESLRIGSKKISASRPEQTKELYILLGQTIIDAQLTEEKFFKLVFNDQTRVEIYSTPGQEACVIWGKIECISV